ncbi:MAG: hypothetical protein H6741_17550 [Alphaproteobacteria bacterium]|nr:hypothetical protein [Alphaproteobacteria bacterium]MCB9794524.1 hypothetical protein [Alphaproteobacteria bacterium]
MLSLLLLMCSGARADEPVMLYEDPLPEALERVQRDTQRAAVSPRRLTELYSSERPQLVGPRPLHPCAGPPGDNATLLRLVSEAEELRVAMQAEAARAKLDEGLRTWGCMAEPADAALGARLHFLLGISRFAAQDSEGAAQAFRAALRSAPDMAWDSDFAPDARALFEQVRAEPPQPRLTLTLVPASAPVGLRVDGRTLALQDGQAELTAGPHLLQLQDGTPLWGDFQGDAWLVLPAALEDSLVREVESEAGRLALEGLSLGAGLGDPVLVPSPSATWALSEGEWTRYRRGPLVRARWPLVAVGGAVALGGAGWMWAEHSAALARQAEVDGSLGSAGYDDLTAQHAQGHARWQLATGLTAAGAASLGLGLGVVVVTW